MRQEAFQHHPTLQIRHKLPCFVMSQSIESSSRAKSSPRAKACPMTMLRPGKWRWSEVSSPCFPVTCFAVSRQLLSTSTWPSRHCWGTGPLCSCFQLSLLQHRRGHSSAPHRHCSPHHSLCQQRNKDKKPPATPQVSAAETCRSKGHSEPSSPGAEGTGLLTIVVLLSRGQRKAGLTCLLALWRKHKQWFSDHSATQGLPSSQALPLRKRNIPCCSLPSSTCCTSAPWHRAALEVVHFYVHTESTWQLRS